MARPRKPTALLEAAGAYAKNPKRRAERGDEPKHAKGIGAPPATLSKRAKEIWRATAPALESAGVVVAVERESLACYCRAVETLEWCDETIQTEGRTVLTNRGMVKHPAVNIQREFSLVVARFASEFGLTPASRSKVKAMKGETEEESFASV